MLYIGTGCPGVPVGGKVSHLGGSSSSDSCQLQDCKLQDCKTIGTTDRHNTPHSLVAPKGAGRFAVWARLGATMSGRHKWGVFAVPWDPFGNQLGTLWWHFFAPQSAAQASNLRAFWSSWGCLLGVFGVPLGRHWTSWVTLGIPLRSLRGALGALGQPLGDPWRHFGPLC